MSPLDLHFAVFRAQGADELLSLQVLAILPPGEPAITFRCQICLNDSISVTTCFDCFLTHVWLDGGVWLDGNGW